MDEKDEGYQQRSLKSVWIVSREYDGLAGAGGVKDVSRQLAETLYNHGKTAVCVIMPRYGFMDAGRLGFEMAEIGGAPGRIGGESFANVFSVDMDYADQERRETVAIWQRVLNGVTVYRKTGRLYLY